MQMAEEFMPELICLREKWHHHAPVSGFDPLFFSLEQQFPGRVISYFFSTPPEAVRRIHHFRKMWRLIRGSTHITTPVRTSPFVSEHHEIFGAMVIRRAKRHPNALILLSVGENQFGMRFAEAEASIRRRTVLFLHQPPSWLRLHWRDFSALDGLGAIVCLSHDQMEYVAGNCRTPVILSRHGVCHDFFMPKATPLSSTSAKLLFVGQWLRDFETLGKAMALVWIEQPKVTLDCVIPYERRNHPALLKLARDPRVAWHANVSPEALRDLYQNATLLFLPLIDATANNALAEALSSGLPIVSTRVGGAVDYIPDAAGELCSPYEVGTHARAVLKWLGEQTRLEKAALAGRSFAQNSLDWKTISHDLIENLKICFH